MLLAARSPVEFSGDGSELIDADGRRYLDFATSFGVFNLGHRHPGVAAAVDRQLDRVATAAFGLTTAAELTLRDRLAEVLPGDLTTVFFSGSGSEAAEVALRLVFGLSTPQSRIVSTTKAYHGKTLGALGLIGQPHLRAPFGALLPDVVFVPTGDAEAMAAAIDERVRAVFVEPVTAGNFLVTPPVGYLAAVRRACDRVGALLVVDEVQTGLGRTGRLFGVDRDGVVPDILFLSKALTGGHVPLAATAVSDRLLMRLRADAPDLIDALAAEAPSPLACAAAVAALEATVEQGLPANAARQGLVLREGLIAAARAHPRLVRDADGIGLMTGLVLRNRAVEFALYLKMLRRGVLTGLSLNARAPHPVLRFYPPLDVTEAQIATALATLRDALIEVERLPGPVLDLVHAATRFTSYFPKPLARAAGSLIG